MKKLLYYNSPSQIVEMILFFLWLPVALCKFIMNMHKKLTNKADKENN